MVTTIIKTLVVTNLKVTKKDQVMMEVKTYPKILNL